MDRCPPSEHNRGEGEAYRPGSFKRLLLEPMSERLAEHNLKLLLGLSPLPLPDNNGLSSQASRGTAETTPDPLSIEIVKQRRKLEEPSRLCGRPNSNAHAS